MASLNRRLSVLDAGVGITGICMLKRPTSHVAVEECWKIHVALGIDARVSTYAKVHGLFEGLLEAYMDVIELN